MTERMPIPYESLPGQNEAEALRVYMPKPENGNGHEEETASESSDHDQNERQYATDFRQNELRTRIEEQRLPVSERLSDLVEALVACKERKGTVLLQGETGSGKSIYSPIAVREALSQLGLPDRTIMMQPRRDAARGVARAVAAILREELGEGVGFSTSEAKEIRPETKTGIVTPGIFLRYIKEGQLTNRDVGAIIIDELHEGSIEYHLALGLIKLMQQRGESPLLLLTSATLDKEKIMSYFGLDEEDYLRIEGRTYPVEKSFLPEQGPEGAGRTKAPNDSYLKSTALEVNRLLDEGGDGDILVFLPGAREIREVMAAIRPDPTVEVLPLHGVLSPDERDRALSGKRQRGIRRKVIVSTNIAETSVTIPGIKVVVDSGRQRSVRFNPDTGINETGTEFISKDQAEQRAGRAGRISSGICRRIYTEGQFDSFLDHPESEIKRKNISNVVLQTKAIGIEPEDFPFIEPPEKSSIDEAVRELQSLGALDDEKSLTHLGYEMSELPFEPRLARMILFAKEERCLPQALVIAAFAREGDVLLGPTRKDIEQSDGFSEADKKRAARRKVQSIQAGFERGGSDFMKYLNIFAEAIDHGVFEASRNDGGPEARRISDGFEDWCRSKYLRSTALRHIAYKLQDYTRYLNRGKDGAEKTFLDHSTLADELTQRNDGTVAATILSAYPDKLLYRSSQGHGLPEYRPLSGASKAINFSPGSSAFDAAPALCIAGSIQEGKGTFKGSEITRNYARDIQPIGIAEMRKVLPRLLQEEARGSRYDKDKDEVITDTDIYARNASTSVLLGQEAKVTEGDPAVSVFAGALADGKVDLPCVEHNRNILDEVRRNKAKARGRISPPNLEEWYRSHLGTAHRKKDALALGDSLNLDRDAIFPADVRADIEAHYPDRISIAGTDCMISYSYRDGADDQSRFSAQVELRGFNADRVFALQTTEIPTIGNNGDGLRVAFETDWISGAVIVDTDLDALKDKLSRERSRRAWNEWTGKPAPRPLPVNLLEEMPSPESLGAGPIAYTEDWRKQQVFAYPAIRSGKQWVNDRYVGVFTLDYFRDREEAEAVASASSQAKKEMDDAETERISTEKLCQEAETRLSAVKTRVAAIGEAFLNNGFSPTAWTEIATRIKNGAKLISGKDDYGYQAPRKPAEAVEQAKAAEDIFLRVEMLNTMRPALTIETNALRDELSAGMKRVAGDYERVGLSYEQYAGATTDWQAAQSEIDTPNGDLVAAKDHLQNIKRLFVDKPEIQKWSTPQAIRFDSVAGRAERNISSKFTVRAGRAFDPISGNELKYLNAGYGASASVIPYGGRACILLENEVGQGTGKAFLLDDGDYAMPKDAGSVFKVKMSGGSIIGVDSEIGQVDAPSGATTATGSTSSGSRNHATNRRYDSESPSTLSAPRLGSFADIFDRAKTPAQPEPTDTAEDHTPKQSANPEARPAPERPEEGPLSQEARESLLSEMDDIKLYFDRIRAIGNKVADPKTQREKALNATRDRISTLQRDYNALATEIASAGPSARESSLRGKVVALAGSAKALLKKHKSDLLPSSFDIGWLERYQQMRESIASSISTHEMASAIIAEGMSTSEEVVSLVDQRLRERIPDIELGKEVSIPEILDQVVDKLTA